MEAAAGAGRRPLPLPAYLHDRLVGQAPEAALEQHQVGGRLVPELVVVAVRGHLEYDVLEGLPRQRRRPHTVEARAQLAPEGLTSTDAQQG